MNLWNWIKEKMAQPDPFDVDSYLAPDSNPPPPSSMFTPGETDQVRAMEVEDHGRKPPVHGKR